MRLDIVIDQTGRFDTSAGMLMRPTTGRPCPPSSTRAVLPGSIVATAVCALATIQLLPLIGMRSVLLTHASPPGFTRGNVKRPSASALASIW